MKGTRIVVTVKDLELAVNIARELRASGRPRSVRTEGLVRLFGGAAPTPDELRRVREALEMAGVAATPPAPGQGTATVLLSLAPKPAAREGTREHATVAEPEAAAARAAAQRAGPAAEAPPVERRAPTADAAPAPPGPPREPPPEETLKESEAAVPEGGGPPEAPTSEVTEEAAPQGPVEEPAEAQAPAEQPPEPVEEPPPEPPPPEPPRPRTPAIARADEVRHQALLLTLAEGPRDHLAAVVGAMVPGALLPVAGTLALGGVFGLTFFLLGTILGVVMWRRPDAIGRLAGPAAARAVARTEASPAHLGRAFFLAMALVAVPSAGAALAVGPVDERDGAPASGRAKGSADASPSSARSSGPAPARPDRPRAGAQIRRVRRAQRIRRARRRRARRAAQAAPQPVPAQPSAPAVPQPGVVAPGTVPGGAPAGSATPG